MRMRARLSKIERHLMPRTQRDGRPLPRIAETSQRDDRNIEPAASALLERVESLRPHTREQGLRLWSLIARLEACAFAGGTCEHFIAEVDQIEAEIASTPEAPDLAERRRDGRLLPYESEVLT